MSLISVVGIILILGGGALARESAILASMTAIPFWIGMQITAQIALRGADVALHRRNQLRAFAAGFSIILMRPGVIILENLVPSLHSDDKTISASLKTVMWWVFVWVIVSTEIYLTCERSHCPAQVAILPSTDLTRGELLQVEQGNGLGSVKEHGSTNPSWVDGAYPVKNLGVLPMVNNSRPFLPPKFHKAVLERATYLNESTILLMFQIAEPYMVIPGQHIGLIHEMVFRPYTPTTHPNLAKQGKVEIIVRLVPNGEMSKIIKAAVQNLSNASGKGKFEISLPPVDTITFQPAIIFSGTMLLVGAGAGVTPFLNMIRGALAANTPTTRIHLIWGIRSEADNFLIDLLPLWNEISAKKFTFNIVVGSRISAGTHLEDLLASLKQETQQTPHIFVSGPDRFVRSVYDDCRTKCNVIDDSITAIGLQDR
jgi:NAD(P)H-flavin reductase